jgi:hypothetical protein
MHNRNHDHGPRPSPPVEWRTGVLLALKIQGMMNYSGGDSNTHASRWRPKEATQPTSRQPAKVTRKQQPTKAGSRLAAAQVCPCVGARAAMAARAARAARAWERGSRSKRRHDPLITSPTRQSKSLRTSLTGTTGTARDSLRSVEMVNARPVRSRPRLMQLGRLGPRALSTSRDLDLIDTHTHSTHSTHSTLPGS